VNAYGSNVHEDAWSERPPGVDVLDRGLLEQIDELLLPYRKRAADADDHYVNFNFRAEIDRQRGPPDKTGVLLILDSPDFSLTRAASFEKGCSYVRIESTEEAAFYHLSARLPELINAAGE